MANCNVLMAIEQVRSKSSILGKMIEDGEISITGGMYYVDSGKVDFFENEHSL